MNERKELTEIQRFALRAAREKALEAQSVLQKIVNEICLQYSIPEAEMSNWQFIENFKYLEKIKREPKATIPSGRAKK